MKVLPVLLFLFISANCVHLSLYSFMLKIFKSNIFKIIDQNVIEKECAQDLKSFFVNFKNYKLWTLQMLDASAKIYPGLLEGNIHLFGNFDQCLSIKDSDQGRTIEGQYCTVILPVKDEILGDLTSSLNLEKLTKTFLKNSNSNYMRNTPQNKMLSLGLCIPKSCSVSSLQTLAHAVEKSLKLPSQATIIDDLCLYKNKPMETDQFDSLIYFLFLVVFILVIGSTFYDLLLRSLGQSANIFVVFSAYTNLEKLLSSNSNDNALSSLHGIKVFSNMWIILGHTCLYNLVVVKNPIYLMTEWKNKVLSVFVWNSFYAVETFFTVSGLLTSYLYLKHSERNDINLISFYLVRLLRLTSPMLAVVFVHISVLKLVATGPYGYTSVKTISENCRNVWWEFLFYFIRLPDINKCARYTWYLSIDTQLYLCAPLILFFIKKHPKRVIGGMISACFTGILYCLVVTINKKLGSTLFELNSEYMDDLYTTKLYHMASWLIGIFFGYLLNCHKTKIPTSLNVVLWVLSIYVITKLIINKLSLVEIQYDVYRSAMWNAFAQPTWSLAVCYIIYSCGTKNGGFINDFLSHYIFKVLGRLTYCIYLTHTPVLLLFFFNKKEANYFDNFHYVLTFMGLYIVILLCSVLLYLGFEAPVTALKNHIKIFKRPKVTKRKNVKITEKRQKLYIPVIN